MTAEIVERVLRSRRYRHVAPNMVERLAAEELRRSSSADEAVKRVKRRLHQAVGAFAGSHTDRPVFTSREACREAMRGHASTRERLPFLERFYPAIFEHTGLPQRLMDLGSGLNPLALPWMGIGDATYLAFDVDERPLAVVRAYLEAVGQAHVVEARDLVLGPAPQTADVALLLKLVATLDRQDPAAAGRLLRGLRARHAVVSFATRSLGGRKDRRERAYRDRMERLAAEAGTVTAVAEASVPNELVFVLSLGAAE